MAIRLTIIFSIILYCLKLAAIADDGHNIQSDPILKVTKASISSINVLNIFPHDAEAFTQGILYSNGNLFESTGLKGKSSLRKVDIKSGKILKEFKLDQKYFAEGITIHEGKIYQLTWLSNIAFVYDLASFKLLNKFSYDGEGWGITSDGKNLLMSNGTAVINFIDPEHFTVVRKINVHDGNKEIGNLNELEFIHGEIWANVFMKNVIARISPQTGEVLGWVDLSKLYDLLPIDCTVDVLNGIAYDQDNDRIFVTGKYWPKIFEIKLTTKDHK
jgi:glutaminyl-peptide cyclotransferase